MSVVRPGRKVFTVPLRIDGPALGAPVVSASRGDGPPGEYSTPGCALAPCRHSQAPIMSGREASAAASAGEPSSVASHFSASRAAMQPMPAAVTA